MNRAFAAAARWCEEIAALSAQIGRAVRPSPGLLTERAGLMSLAAPGRWSANRSCRLVRAADGWLAVNLPRESDLELIPAWLGRALDEPAWPAILRAARTASAGPMAQDAHRLGLAVSAIGSVSGGSGPAVHRMAAPARGARRRPLVVDLSSLWAGPLCGRLLGEASAWVVKVESRTRPDGMAAASSAFFERLNGGKTRLALDFSSPADLERLRGLVAQADVLITSARPRAFDGLGLSPASVFAANPRLTWVAITGHGWFGEAGGRVGFGDDAAAAAGLVRWTPDGRPRFLGDALADPLTGLAATAAALEALQAGGGVLIDAALAAVAAGVAHEDREARAA